MSNPPGPLPLPSLPPQARHPKPLRLSTADVGNVPQGPGFRITKRYTSAVAWDCGPWAPFCGLSALELPSERACAGAKVFKPLTISLTISHQSRHVDPVYHAGCLNQACAGTHSVRA